MTKEDGIARFFDKESQSMANRHDEELPATASKHIELISQAGSKKALDVGSGPGSVIIGLLESGVDNAIGIDLSPKMKEVAYERLKEHELEGRVELIQGSFLEYDVNKEIDGVSIHRVICCHPNREGMVNKSLEARPRIVVNTVPKDYLWARFLTAIIGPVLSLLFRFRFYIHSQDKIDRQFFENGYSIAYRESHGFWVTTGYELKELEIND